MSKNSLIILVGILIFIASFLGIPSSWKTLVFGALGLLVVGISLLLRREITTGALCMHLEDHVKEDSFAQNGALSRKDRKDRNEERHYDKEATTEFTEA